MIFGSLQKVLIAVIFLAAFSGCNMMKRTGAQSGFAGKVSIDSDYPDYVDEKQLDVNYNNPGKTAGNPEYNYQENTNGNPDFTTVGTVDDNLNYEQEEVLIDNPNSNNDVDDISTFESSLSADGNFVNITQDEIDPENNVSGESAVCDEDIYTNVIWVPSSNYAYSGWNPYSNGKWAWSRQGWTWVSNYRWGWATYHYGRWWYSSKYGWVWSPGRRWAPAWVVWGHHKDYEGWHPISPRVHILNHGIISTVMPHYQQNGWVFVGKNDFTKTVNNSTTISVKDKNDILKNSAVSITLKQDGNKLFNDNVISTKNKKNQETSVEKKSPVQVTTKKKTGNNTNVKNDVTNVKQNKNAVIINKNDDIGNNTAVKETPKKVTDKKSKIIVSETPNTKQNNTVSVNKNSTVENKTAVKNNPVKTNISVSETPNTKQNNTVSVNKNTAVENKTTVKNNTVKTNESVSTTPNTKQNNTVSVNKNVTIENKTVIKENQNKTVSNTKKENTNNNNVAPSNTIKSDNSNKTVNSVPKVNQGPKVSSGPVINSQEKVLTKKEDK